MDIKLKNKQINTGKQTDKSSIRTYINDTVGIGRVGRWVPSKDPDCQAAID